MLANEWQKLSSALVQMMEQRLGQEFPSFATFCETTGLLRDNFLQIDDLIAGSSQSYDPTYVCSMCAAAVVSAGNHYGRQGDMETAKRLAAWALELEPACVPAMLCLVTCGVVEERDEQVALWQRRIRETYRMLREKPQQQLTAYESGLLEAGEPELG